MIRGDASEFHALAEGLAKVGPKTIPPLRAAMGQAGKVAAQAWKANAAATSGVHGKHYPNSIDSELAFTITSVSVDVGPNAAYPQGSMGRGFEFGSRNQPPHLDGVKALEAVGPVVEKLVGDAIGDVFP